MSRPLAITLLISLTIFALGTTLFWSHCWALIPTYPLFNRWFNVLCPVASEETRFPAGVDVLVSSRNTMSQDFGVTVLPGGRKVLYDTGSDFRIYDLDTTSDEEITFDESINSSPLYITDEWALNSTAYSWSLFNLETGETLPLTTIDTDADFAAGIPEDTHDLIRQHPLAYIVWGRIIIVPTYLGDPTTPAYILQGYIDHPHNENSDRVAAQLRELGAVVFNPTTIYTPDDAFYYTPADKSYRQNTADLPTIVETQTNRPVVVSPLADFQLLGWAEGQRGVVMSAAMFDCVYGHLGCVGEPILLLRQAPEHLSPEMQAHFAAKDAAELANLQNAKIGMVIFLIVSGGLVFATVWAIARYRPAATPTFNAVPSRA